MQVRDRLEKDNVKIRRSQMISGANGAYPRVMLGYGVYLGCVAALAPASPSVC